MTNVKKCIYRVAMIADIHLGVISVNRQKQELETIFFQDLEKLKSLDLIVVLGDVYDKKIYLNDEVTSVAIWFYQRLIQIARQKNAKVRLMYGTKSHEADQYNLLQHISQNDSDDIQVIYQAGKETLQKGITVLYLPEEHIYSKSEYYSDLIYNVEEPYTYVFGHGVIDEILKTGEDTAKEVNRLHVPRFTIGDFRTCCKGCVFFGHYHIHSQYENFVYYVGSYNRWQFGEEESKGYMMSEYDFDRESYKNTFIENPLTDRYQTFYYGYKHPIFSSEDRLLEEFCNLEKMIDDQKYEKIRCILHMPETLEHPDFYVNAFRERFRFSDDIKFDFGEGFTERARVADKEKAKQIREEYEYLNDESLGIDVITSRFASQELKKSISPERVKVYIDANSIDELL